MQAALSVATPFSNTRNTPIEARQFRKKVAILGVGSTDDGNLVRCLQSIGYDAERIPCDGDALTRIADGHMALDAVILDRRGASDVDVALLKGLGADPRLDDLPRLLLVGSQDDKQIIAALEADIHHFIRTPIQATVLKATLNALGRRREVESARARPSQDTSEISLIETCRLRLRTPAEAHRATTMLAGFFPDRRRATLGITELVSNAIEHGNLEIGRAMKVSLMKSGALPQEVYARLMKPEYTDRTVEVIVDRRDEGVMLTVTDQGQGFDWKEHLDVDPALANLDHGRGIARARHLAFDNLTFNARGNQAIAIMSRSQKVDW